MAAFGVRFESATDIEDRKEQTRLARAEVLRQAKSNFKKEQRCKELKQFRGEDTWMLPDVNEQIEQFSQEHSVKKKKKREKHSKRVKKEKKKKSKKQKREEKSESTDSSSSSEEWVEAVPSQIPGKEKTWKVKDKSLEKECDSHTMQRDEWMTVDFMSVKTVSSSSLKAEKETLRKIEQEKAQALEQSMEIFQSKLKEAEKIACKREDYGRERWRKPAYSDSTQPSQTSSISDLVKCKKDSKDRHFATEVAKRSIGDCEFSGPDTRNQSGSLETCIRESALRQRQESSGNLRPKFLRPSDEDELSLHNKRRNFEPSTSSSTLVAQASLHCDFQKPTENSEENLTSWSLCGRQGRDRKHSDQKPLETWSRSADQHSPGDMREQLQAESLRGDPPRRGHLQNIKAAFSGPEAESTCILNVDEKNKLGAKIIKAEMMGNMQEDEEVILTRTDESGRVWPVNTPGGTLDMKARRRKRQGVSTHEDKERIRYFPDDDHLSLKDLVKNEKMGTDIDQNRLFMRMASKFMGKPDGDYYTLDDMFVSKAAEKERFGEREESQRRKAIAEHQSLTAQMARCLYCFDSSQFPKHLIVAIGVKVYLCLPNFRSLTEGHCLIVPLQHLQAATMLDEDIWEEIQTFRKSLVKMFEEKGLDCIFLETNMGMKKQYHMVYECIPLPREMGDMAPIYFKKAIIESDEEWSMNKKLIDLSSKDIRKSVPRSLPYFAVEFGLQGGFAHVIEDQHKFPRYFGKEIIGGMLDLEPRLWKKGIRESFEDQRKKALQFAQWWKPFDVTKSKSC
ncbi:hypothetical protein ACRRTK_016081 [Alexandromys fortis]